MIAYSGLKSRIDRLANKAKVYGDVPYIGFISRTEDDFILELRFKRKGNHFRSEERRFQSQNGLNEYIIDIENKYGKGIIVFYAENELVN